MADDTDKVYYYLDQKDFVLKLSEFDGGFVDNIEEDLLKTEECAQADNVLFTNHIINMRKGSQYYGNAPTSYNFISLFYFTKY